MRVGLLTTSFPRFAGDVAGSFVLGFARALAGQGHAVHVLAPEPAEPCAPPSWPGVRVEHVPYLRPRGLQRTFYGAGVPDNLRRDPRAWLGPVPFSAALALAARARSGDWDAVVSHWALPCGLIGAGLRGSSGLRARRHVCVLHSADLHLLHRLPLRRQLARALVAGSDVLWFVSQRGHDDFMALLSSAEVRAARARAVVRPMGYDLPQPSGADRDTEREVARARLGLDRFTLLTVARLVPIKGLREALTALGHRADLTWLIAGDGPERAALLALASRLQLRVRLLGTVTGADKHALFLAADAFVLPSRELPSGRTEGVPTALLEAMASGVPVIASSSGGMGEWVQPGITGFSCDPASPRTLEHAVDTLRSTPDLGGACAARALSRVQALSWDAQAPALTALVCGPHAQA